MWTISIPLASPIDSSLESFHKMGWNFPIEYFWLFKSFHLTVVRWCAVVDDMLGSCWHYRDNNLWIGTSADCVVWPQGEERWTHSDGFFVSLSFSHKREWSFLVLSPWRAFHSSRFKSGCGPIELCSYYECPSVPLTIRHSNSVPVSEYLCRFSGGLRHQRSTSQLLVYLKTTRRPHCERVIILIKNSSVSLD